MKAINFREIEKFADALEQFKELGSYKDAVQQVQKTIYDYANYSLHRKEFPVAPKLFADAKRKNILKPHWLTQPKPLIPESLKCVLR